MGREKNKFRWRNGNYPNYWLQHGGCKVNETHLSLTSAVEAGSSYFRDTYKIITSSSAGTVQ